MVSTGAFAADGEWTVRKASGEVWTGARGVQPVSLGQESVLKPGDTVTTGRNGRVLLVRGQETILIAPNSIVGVPAEKKDGLATTITQQAGSILLEVEKRNVPHFEVETPYLAAVVKGTQFRVSVTATGTRVEVHARPGRSRRLQDRADRAGPSRASRAILRAGHAGSLAHRVGHVPADRARDAARTDARTDQGAEVRHHDADA